MKNTKQRKVILEIINRSNEHLNAYEIYEEARKTLKNISLGTVYRNLNCLCNENLITIVNDGQEKKRYDKIEKHQHFICTRCNKIIDIYEPIIKPLKKYENNLVMNYKIILEGICEKCLKEEENGIKRK